VVEEKRALDFDERGRINETWVATNDSLAGRVTKKTSTIDKIDSIILPESYTSFSYCRRCIWWGNVLENQTFFQHGAWVTTVNDFEFLLCEL